VSRQASNAVLRVLTGYQCSCGNRVAPPANDLFAIQDETLDVVARHEPYTTFDDSHMYCGCGAEDWSIEHVIQAAKEAERER